MRLPRTTAILRSGDTRAALAFVDVDAVLNWLTRRLDVNNEPLGEVLREFNRYSEKPTRAGSPAIDQLRISAVLRAGDIDALRAALKGAFGLEIEQRGGEWVVVDPKATVPAPH